MKISTNTIKLLNQHFGSAGDPAPNGVDDLAVKIGAQLGGIEEIIDFGSKYDGVLIVRIVSCEKHSNADKLNICLIDDGGKAEGVERNAEGLVQVVCGAPNVRAGMLVAWLPPGSTVPESASKEPFVLGTRELRGIVSNGMLASPRELALGDGHDGILEIALDSDEVIEPGTWFSEVYHLKGDVIFDIENKMFTHRPDCFGIMGLAREIEGIYQRPYKSPEWYRSGATIPAIEAEPLELEIRNELPALVPRFTAVTMRGVVVKPSPLWLQIDLARHGMRSINNIVDYTNYFMLLTGQPLHAYDYDKVKALDGADKAAIVIRNPHAGEKIRLLNGKDIEPRSEAIMIASASQLIGVGGVMGGGDTEVDETTRNIIIEAANFDMYSVRRTSMAHGLFTDAVSRFNKGQSPLQNRAVLGRIVEEIRRFADGKVASDLLDVVNLPAEVLERNAVHAAVSVGVDFMNVRLGLSLTADGMKTLLSNVEFEVTAEADNLTVKAPFWRTDIEIPEDIVEEVGRLYGFDRLPLELPSRSMLPVAKNSMFELKQELRDNLKQAGANEVLTYSFVHGKLLDAVGQQRNDAYRLSNALSPDVQYYRQSLTPSLLDKVHANIKAGYDEFALFEIGKGHVKGADQDGLPYEFERLAVVFAADPKAAKRYDGAAYYQAKKYFDNLAEVFGLTNRLKIAALDPSTYKDATATKISAYEPGRAAVVSVDDTVIGEIGEYKASVLKALKLPGYSAGFEIDITALAAKRQTEPTYQPLSRFPKVEQDLCLKVDASMPYQQLYDFVAAELAKGQNENVRFALNPVDIYQRDDDPDYKQITLRLSVVNLDKTMRDSEVTAMLDEAARVAQTAFGAQKI